MPRVVWTEPATRELQEVFTAMDDMDHAAAAEAAEGIVIAAGHLQENPKAGTAASDLALGQRELRVPFGKTGHVLLYEIEGQEVRILAVRHLRDAGY